MMARRAPESQRHFLRLTKSLMFHHLCTLRGRAAL